MFMIRAATSDKFEVKNSIEQVREFFSDIRNFIELMPNVESIYRNPDGTLRWTIRAKIPLIGAIQQSFSVELWENTDERIEWIPRANEKQNLLRYAADFIEKSGNTTLIHFSQTVELRRNSARELNLLAGLAGERRISQGMQWEVGGMIKSFMQKAKQKLETTDKQQK